MSTFPLSPRLLKGALVTFNLPNPQPSVISFQYNPETLSRTLEAQTSGGEGGDRAEALRIKGAPVEKIALEIELDATDQLERGEAPTGVHPQLAALELLIYPSSSLVIANTALLALGTIEIIPPQAPFTLFIWGPKRVLPVRVSEFSITEEAYDPQLNPIRATVSLGLRVLSYNDLPITNPGYHLFLAHQIVKETMAASARGSSLDATGAGPMRLG
ncbi:MAG TPA: hypothetical protein PKA05_22525 [Roseiflexaceae bacterium]|nr:hypothetical protein [Roseiflexaceae bacterium]HMP43168.1 hypothetical protein [Roseiflexaceae bacterium]